MAVDYEEGRRLLALHRTADAKLREWPSAVDVADEMRASTALSNWLYANREALLNPDPWRPIEEAPKDGTRLHILNADGTEEAGVYWSDDRYCIIGAPMGSRGPGWVSTEAGHLPVDPPTHFRELKGPGHV